MEYRARFGADTILQDWTPPEVLTRCFPGGFFGEDKGGHPVWYDCMGNLDFRGTSSTDLGWKVHAVEQSIQNSACDDCDHKLATAFLRNEVQF